MRQPNCIKFILERSNHWQSNDRFFVLRNWIKKYTSHDELKNSDKGMSRTLTIGRIITAKERIEVAQVCIANDKN